MVVGALVWIGRENDRLHQAYLDERGADLDATLQVENTRLIQSIETLRQNVVFLATTPPVSGIVRANANHGIDPRDNNSTEKWEQRLQEIFAAFLRAHPEYFQARYIGVANGGKELVRVESHDARITVTSRTDLQAKGDQDYFKAGVALRSGQVYLSEFTLNQEHGKIEAPHRPALRSVTPVFDADGKVFGVVMLNMDVSSLLSSATVGLPIGVQAYIADAQGNYLLHPVASRAFAFELGGNDKIGTDFPMLAAMLEPSAKNSLSMRAVKVASRRDYLAAKRIFFDSGDPSRFLLLVYRLPDEVISQQSRGLNFPNVFDVLMVMTLLGGISALILRGAFAPLKRIAHAARKIAAGDHKIRLAENGGELGELSEALNAMLEKLVGHDLLEKEHAFKKELIDSLPGVFYMIDMEGRFLLWNRNFLEVLQRSDEDMATTHPLDLFEGADRAHIEQAIYQVFELGEASVDGDLVAKDGSRIPYHFTGRRIQLDSVPVLVGMGLDVSQQRTLLREAEALLRRNHALMQNSMEGLHVMDIDGNVLDVNDSFCRMLGYTRDEALRLNVHDWDKQFSAEQLHARFQEFIGKCGIFETVHRRKDGSLLDVEICTNGVEIDGNGYLFASSRDISERKKTQSLLQRFKVAIETSHDGYWLTDIQGKILEANQAYADLSGYTVDELRGLSISDLEANENPEDVKARIVKLMDQGFDVFETRHRRKNGSVVDVEISTSLVRETQQLVVFSRDITARKGAEQELRIAAAAFETRDAIVITDAQSNIIRVNHAFTEITGYTVEEVLGKNPRIMSSGRQDKAFYEVMWQQINENGSWAGEIWDRRKNGEVYPKWLTITSVKNERRQTTQYVAIFSDITARKQAEDEIRNLAFYDALTQLPNRRLLQERLHVALLASARYEDYGALLFVDLDRFKMLNDTLGHDYGDLLLIEVASRIKSCVREMDTVARLGGDEFVVLLENIGGDLEDASHKVGMVAEKIRAALAHPYMLKEHEYYSSPSIGISLYHDADSTMDELLKHADAAMYQAKNAGRNAVRFYDPNLQHDLETRATLENDLRRAIENNELHLYYQVQVDINHQPTGVEALLRWIHPQRGLVSPAKFIPIAEDSSLILEIGNWVLEGACAQLAAWASDERMSHLSLAINVSAHQFRLPDFVETVASALSRHNVVTSRLKLELTEGVVVNDLSEVATKMLALKALGVQLSLDDFGTGYSSLTYLKRLPLDQLKIDQSFIRDITSDPSDAGLVQTIIDMAKNFKQDVIAEGVETEAQLAFLKHYDCKSYQGYFFSKPIPVEELWEMMQKLQ